jgi:hypothetical protein
MVRRQNDGAVALLGEVTGDQPLFERAARRLVGCRLTCQAAWTNSATPQLEAKAASSRRRGEGISAIFRAEPTLKWRLLVQPEGVALNRPWPRCSALKEARSSCGLAPCQGLFQGNCGVAEFVHAA